MQQCALNVIGEVVSAFVDLICAKGGLVAALRVLHRRSVGRCIRVGLRFPIHHLTRHVAVARVDKQPGAVGPVNFSVCALLFEPGQPPRSDKPVPDALISTAILAAGQRHCGHTYKQRHDPERKQLFHIRSLVTSCLPSWSARDLSFSQCFPGIAGYRPPHYRRPLALSGGKNFSSRPPHGHLTLPPIPNPRSIFKTQAIFAATPASGLSPLNKTIYP